MLATVLVEYPWLTTIALVGLVVLGPVLGARLVSRPRMTRVLLGASVMVVALLTFVPTDREHAVGCTMAWDLPTLGAVELMANVIMFAPVVLLAGVGTGRPCAALFAASGVSVLIELAQALAPALGRSCSSNDWLANTLGALVGAASSAVALRLARRPGQRHRGRREC